MATHKTFPNEILRCRSRMTRLEMLTTNYNLKNLLWALHLQIIIKTKISDN